MIEELFLAHKAKLNVRLVETRHPDGMRTSWHFEEIEPRRWTEPPRADEDDC